MKILFIGDIVGEPGRRALKLLLPTLKEELKPTIIIVNCENAAGGKGITKEIGEELFKAGADILTSGNHHWSKKGIEDYTETEKRLIRPANFPTTVEFPCPGRGYVITKDNEGSKIGVINLQGRVFMSPLDCPFQIVDKIISEISGETRVIFVDIHAEATSEKRALGFYLDGRVSAVIGTHTHVQTADEQILPQGTAYLTDVGMTGIRDSAIGVDFNLVIQRMISARPIKYDVPKRGISRLNGCVVEIDPKTGKAKTIKRINKEIET